MKSKFLRMLNNAHFMTRPRPVSPKRVLTRVNDSHGSNGFLTMTTNGFFSDLTFETMLLSLPGHLNFTCGTYLVSKWLLDDFGYVVEKYATRSKNCIFDSALNHYLKSYNYAKLLNQTKPNPKFCKVVVMMVFL